MTALSRPETLVEDEVEFRLGAIVKRRRWVRLIREYDH